MESRVENPRSADEVMQGISESEQGSLARSSEVDQMKALGSTVLSIQSNHAEAGRAVRTTASSRGSFNTARVSILVLTKNGMPDIRNCLKAVYDQCTTNPFEVIVVDSGSTDETLEVAKAFHVQLEQVPPATFHHARTRNFAADLASGEILVFLSQDAIPSSDRWLDAMVANFADPSVGAVYGRQLPRPDSS